MNKTTASPRFVRATPRTGKRLYFYLNGEPMSGFLGETVLTAILCNTDHVRRFEFADSFRAGFCIMAACQDCWLWRENGARLRACTTPLEDGMRFLSVSPLQERGEP